MNSTPDFWQALHTAYEEHNPDEARRLLRNSDAKPDCRAILRCGDEAYIRWLLSHDIIQPPAEEAENWPGLQEVQLQCSALPESARPACVISGALPPNDQIPPPGNARQ